MIAHHAILERLAHAEPPHPYVLDSALSDEERRALESLRRRRLAARYLEPVRAWYITRRGVAALDAGLVDFELSGISG